MSCVDVLGGCLVFPSVAWCLCIVFLLKLRQADNYYWWLVFTLVRFGSLAAIPLKLMIKK